MDPYGTFGLGEGIPYQQPVQPVRTMDNWQMPSVQQPAQSTGSQYLNPNWNQFNPVPLIPDSFNQGNPVGPAQPSAADIYNSIPQPAYPSGGGGGVNPGAIDDWNNNSDTWRNRLYAERAAATSGGGGGGSVRAPEQVKNVKPMEAMKMPGLPEYKGPGEYKPPEEDKSVYNTARREAMGPGLRELREGSREAISGAESLDNPNARGKFIQQALKGYGQGLEKVAAGAAKEGRIASDRARAEQLSTYKINYDVKSDVYLKNYQNEINTIAANFASEQNAQAMNWNANLRSDVNVGGMGGSTTGNNVPSGGGGTMPLSALNSSMPSSSYMQNYVKPRSTGYMAPGGMQLY